jgi:hypothetical protein
MLSHEPIRANAAHQFPVVVQENGHRQYWEGYVALGNGTQWFFRVMRHNGYLAVGIRGKPLVIWSGICTTEAVQGAYSLFSADAGNVTDFINAQLGAHAAPRGQYMPELLI